MSGARGVLAVARLELEGLLVRPLSLALGLIFVILIVVSAFVGSLATPSAAQGAELPLGDILAALTLAIMALAIALFGPIVPIANTVDAVSGERARRTIDLLASRPATRRGLMLGKILGRGAHIAVVALVGVLLGAAVASGRVPLAPGEMLVFAGLVVLLCTAWVAITALASTMLKGSGGFGIALGIYFGFFVYGFVLDRLGLGGLAALTNPNTLFLGAVADILPVSQASRTALAVGTSGLPHGMALPALLLFIAAAAAVAVEAFHRQDEGA